MSTSNNRLSTQRSPSEQQQQQQIKQYQYQQQNQIKQQAPRRRKVGLDDFNFLSVLGKGNFGKVMLAESPNQKLVCYQSSQKGFHCLKMMKLTALDPKNVSFWLQIKSNIRFAQYFIPVSKLKTEFTSLWSTSVVVI